MSLLSNLLQFSSVSHTNQPLIRSETKERSNSLSTYNNFAFDYVTDQTVSRQTAIKSVFQDSSLEKCRKSLSKSLSKINMGQNKIDPKVRVIHRLVQQLGRKCRRHFYTFFVSLETIKKKGLTMKTITMTKQESLKVQQNLYKLSQVYEIIFSKRFQKHLKRQFFAELKRYAKQIRILDRFVYILEQKQIYVQKRKFFQKIKQNNENYMKIDILISSITSASQGLQRRAKQADSNQQCSETIEFLHEAFGMICSFYNSKKQKLEDNANLNVQNEQPYRTPTKNKYSFSCLDVLQSISIAQPFYTQNQNITQIKYPNTNNENIHNQFNWFSGGPIQQKSNLQSLQHLNLTQKVNQIQRYKQSPIRIAKAISPINEKVEQFSISKETRTDPVWKSYKVLTQFSQKPVQRILNTQKQRISCQRLKPDWIKLKQIGDLYDGVEIFMKMQPKQRQSFNGSPCTSWKGMRNYPQSNVNSIYGLETIVDKLDRIPDELHFNNCQQQGGRMHSLNNAAEDRTQSQIIYGTPMFSQSQIDIKRSSNQKMQQEQQEYGFRDVHFGSQAVSFKNSLVCQRQSMKKNNQQKGNDNQYYSGNNYQSDNQNISDYISSDGFSTYKYQKNKFSQKQDFNAFGYENQKKSFEKYFNLTNNHEKNDKPIKPNSKSSNSSRAFKNFINSQSIKTPVNINLMATAQHRYESKLQKYIAKNQQTNFQPKYEVSNYQNTYLQVLPNRNSYSATGNYQSCTDNYVSNHSYIGNYIESPIQGRCSDLHTPAKLKSHYRKSKKIDLHLNSITPSADQISRNQPSQYPQINNNFNSLLASTGKYPISRQQVSQGVKARSNSYMDEKGLKRQIINNQIYDKIDKSIPLDIDFGNCLIAKNYFPFQQTYQTPVRDVVINDFKSRQRELSNIDKKDKESWINVRSVGQCIKLRSRRQSMK